MLILALDTTTRQGSCAVMRDAALVAERASQAALAHAVHLPADLMSLLDEAGLTLPQIDAFAVAIGPGSFTGLRVGIATMQGLAFAAGKPLFGVSALDALALAAQTSIGTGGDQWRIVAWIDAWRGEVYQGVFTGGVAAGEPVVGKPETLLAAAPAVPTFFIGDGVEPNEHYIYPVLGDDMYIADPAAPPIAGAVAALAARAAATGARPGPGDITPLYVRRSDAELARDGRPVA